MKCQLLACMVIFGAFFLCSCGGSNESPSESVRFNISFNSQTTDWVGGSSDYSPGTAPGDVIVEPRSLPAPYLGFGLFASGTNRSDDLFVYAKKKVTGLKPHHAYVLTFSVTFLSQAPSGCIGVGGAPGESVTVKAGASSIEPESVLSGNYYIMNIDKGNQSIGGANALALGNIATTNTDCSSTSYESKTLVSTMPLEATSADDGALWLLLGIDSGFEAASNVYYQSLSVTASPK